VSHGKLFLNLNSISLEEHWPSVILNAGGHYKQAFSLLCMDKR